MYLSQGGSAPKLHAMGHRGQCRQQRPTLPDASRLLLPPEQQMIGHPGRVKAQRFRPRLALTSCPDKRT